MVGPPLSPTQWRALRALIDGVGDARVPAGTVAVLARHGYVTGHGKAVTVTPRGIAAYQSDHRTT